MVDKIGLLAGVSLWVASFLWMATTMVLALAQPARRRRVSLHNANPVSIVVPTCAVDSPRTSEDRDGALASLRGLNHPDFEIIVSVDRSAEVSSLTSRLQEENRTSDIRVVSVHYPSSANSKIDAMCEGANAARHETLLFSDDDVVVDPDHLAHLLGQLHGRVGLVSAAAVGIDPRNFWAEVELAFMNGQFARLHLAGDCVGHSGALGKAMMTTRANLVRANGLQAAGGDCCEDAALTRNLAQAGFLTALSAQPVYQPIRRQRCADVVRRHARWLSCRRRYLPKVFLAEAFFSTPATCAIAAYVSACSGHGWALGVIATGLLWCAMECCFLFLKRWPVSTRTPMAWATRELFLGPLWLWALFARSVNWYGRAVPVVYRQPIPVEHALDHRSMGRD